MNRLEYQSGLISVKKGERDGLESLELKEIDLLFALILNPSLDLPCFIDFRIILRTDWAVTPR